MRILLPVLVWVLAAPLTPAAAPAGYPELLDTLEGKRLALADRFSRADETSRRRIRDEARVELLPAITSGMFHAWAGTPWAFHGQTEIPGEGTIACGYFVSTLLRDAGFRVERVSLAQQPAELIIDSLVPPAGKRRFRRRPAAEVIAGVAAQGAGLYLVGLDFHVGFLWNDGTSVSFCHASYLGPATVVCEPAADAPAFGSSYRVTGKLLGDGMIDAWLEGRALPTLQRAP